MALNPEQAESVRKKFLEQIDRLPADKQEYKEQLRQQIMAASPEQLEAALKPRQEKEVECIFCSIAKGEIDAIKVYEDNFVIAFLDINPAAPGQVIVIPKDHQQFIFQIPDHILWSLIKTAKLLEPFVVAAANAGGVSIYISQGDAAGQYFKHLAVYMIPRFEEDKASFFWPRAEAKREDLEAVAKVIKGSVDKIISEERQKMETILKEKQKAMDSTMAPKEPKEEKLYEMPRRK